MTTLDDDDRRQAVAQFRADIIGGLCRRDVPRGALSRAFEELADQRFRPPGSETTRSYAPSTLERWYYAYKNDGLEGLKPKARADRGYAQNLSKQMRKLLLTIRREHPSASVPLILRTLVAEGRLSKGAVSASTIRRFYRAKGLTRRAGHEPEDGRQRLSWEAEAPMSLWHGDVLYGPTIHPEDGEAFETRIHGMLDDASRVVVSLEARRTEREIDMLVGLADALRRWGKPDAMYFDNGSTYRGTQLQEVCTHLEIGLIHARPYDPQARGKMERFWRTLRQGCLDHLGRLESLHELNVRLRAFLDQHYHYAAHGGLMGKAPKEVFDERVEEREPIGETELQSAFVERQYREVRSDSTLDFEGDAFEVDQRFLCSRKVQVCRALLSADTDPWIECEGRRFQMHPVDRTANASRKRMAAPEEDGSTESASSVDFDPTTTALNRAAGRTSSDSTPNGD